MQSSKLLTNMSSNRLGGKLDLHSPTLTSSNDRDQPLHIASQRPLVSRNSSLISYRCCYDDDQQCRHLLNGPSLAEGTDDYYHNLPLILECNSLFRLLSPRHQQPTTQSTAPLQCNSCCLPLNSIPTPQQRDENSTNSQRQSLSESADMTSLGDPFQSIALNSFNQLSLPALNTT